jgi:hypothetical protein
VRRAEVDWRETELGAALLVVVLCFPAFSPSQTAPMHHRKAADRGGGLRCGAATLYPALSPPPGVHVQARCNATQTSSLEVPMAQLQCGDLELVPITEPDAPFTCRTTWPGWSMVGATLQTAY